jgi:D-sedoheptulose 7-phosphate isomerase
MKATCRRATISQQAIPAAEQFLDSVFSILYTARTMKAAIGRIFSESINAKRSFLRGNTAALAHVIDIACETLTGGHKLLLFGNGGSAADAQHLAAEFVNRFKLARAPLPAIALTTDTSVLTSVANDFGYREVFAKQIEAFGQAGDLAFAISTSGNSPSVLRAVERCHKLGITTVGLTGGTGGRLAARVDHLLCVSGTGDTARIQETHILIGHTICELVEVNLARTSGASAATEHGERAKTPLNPSLPRGEQKGGRSAARPRRRRTNVRGSGS